MSDISEPITLDCGCFINPEVIDGVNTLTTSPCRMDCPNLKLLTDLVAAEGKPTIYKEAP